jgi:hypothetical protein
MILRKIKLGIDCFILILLILLLINQKPFTNNIIYELFIIGILFDTVCLIIIIVIHDFINITLNKFWYWINVLNWYVTSLILLFFITYFIFGTYNESFIINFKIIKSFIIISIVFNTLIFVPILVLDTHNTFFKPHLKKSKIIYNKVIIKI